MLYRGVPSKFKDSPLTVSAMRNNEIKFAGNLNYSPTMVMDWTEDIIIADRFSYADGNSGIN